MHQGRQVRVDRIKFDRAFAQGVGATDTGAIVKAIVTLAQALGLCVIAEGMDTLARQAFLPGP